MRRRLIGVLSLSLAGVVTSACSPLKSFDALVPKDGGGRLVVRDAAFGGDLRQRLDIYAPVAGAGRPRAASVPMPVPVPVPVIVFFYGGSWNSGTKDGYAFVGRALAARGFVVAIPDYRLVPEVRYPAFLEDNAAAVRWVRGHVGAIGGDPDRVILAGHSAGAYDAAMLALDPRWLGADRKAVRGLVGLAGPYDFLPFDVPVAVAAFGQAADPRSTQPVNHVATGDPPAFLATGDTDTTVLPRNSDRLGMLLAAAGVPVERRRYPGIGHVGMITAFARPFRGRAPVLDDVAAFVRRVTE